jgi:hypothetical protein
MHSALLERIHHFVGMSDKNGCSSTKWKKEESSIRSSRRTISPTLQWQVPTGANRGEVSRLIKRISTGSLCSRVARREICSCYIQLNNGEANSDLLQIECDRHELRHKNVPSWNRVSRFGIEESQAGPSTERYSDSVSCSESLHKNIPQEYMECSISLSLFNIMHEFN